MTQTYVGYILEELKTFPRKVNEVEEHLGIYPDSRGTRLSRFRASNMPWRANNKIGQDHLLSQLHSDDVRVVWELALSDIFGLQKHNAISKSEFQAAGG
jgi:hypothetical protein